MGRPLPALRLADDTSETATCRDRPLDLAGAPNRRRGATRAGQGIPPAALVPAKQPDLAVRPRDAQRRLPEQTQQRGSPFAIIEPPGAAPRAVSPQGSPGKTT